MTVFAVRLLRLACFACSLISEKARNARSQRLGSEILRLDRAGQRDGLFMCLSQSKIQNRKCLVGPYPTAT